ncbi:MAG: amidohydrolase/deacetylase family metallohydrolase [Acidobacteria bacterium]|nr:amidohydrolase/deacetylase family metallohydrolase [Acidobacteriota bacterium]
MRTHARAVLALILLVLSWSAPALAQDREYDLLIRGGHVIDPKNGLDAVLDVAIAGGRIAAVAANIAPDRATQVADASGMYVVPGLLDIHAHVFYGTEEDAAYSNGTSAIPPDGFTFRSGVTTVVDVGGAGWRNFSQFKTQVIDRSRTRVLAFINIVGSGMKGGPVEQNLTDMDARLTAARARQFPELIVGVKTAHYSGSEWDPVDRAVEAGRQAGIPIMVDFGQFVQERPFEELVTRRLRPGDIYTHAFLGRVPMLDADGKIRPYLAEAQKRGVIFDVGHGGGSFLFRQAVPATRQGFWPDTISTDIHTGSMNGGMKDMANVISKMLNLGMPLSEAIEKSTWAPAKVIQRPDLGHLDVGAAADVAVFRLREGNFGFLDVSNARFNGTRKLECELTVRDGRVVWDLNGIASLDWEQAEKR